MYKFLFWLLLIAILIAGLAGGAYWYGQQRTLKLLKEQQLQVQPTGMMIQTGTAGAAMQDVPNGEAVKDTNLVTPTENTVFFARANGGVLIKYRNVIYDQNYTGDPEKMIKYIDGDYTWYALIDAPAGVPPNEFALDEFFGLLNAPNKKDFAFIMRWGTDKNNFDSTSYYLYDYVPGTTPPLILIKKFNAVEMKPNNFVPRFGQYSASSALLQLNMFPCWNCGGAVPTTGLASLSAPAYKDIGKTSYFKWTFGNEYEYKEYKKIDCPPDQQMGECSEKPENLPMKTGSF